MYKINFNGNYNGVSGCHGKIVDRESLQDALISLLNDGMKVHYVRELWAIKTLDWTCTE